MPLTFRAGLGATVWEEDVHTINAEGDFLTYSDAEPAGSFGAEYVYDDLLSARAGYMLNHAQLGLSWGVGFNYASGNFDAGMDYSMDLTASLGIIHRLNVNVVLDN
jgi:hypothetical protein